MRRFPIVPAEPLAFIRGRHIDARRGASRSDRYRRVRDGLFPRPINRHGTSLWGEHELLSIMRAELAGATDEELQDLVRRIHAAREAFADTTEAANG